MIRFNGEIYWRENASHHQGLRNNFLTEEHLDIIVDDRIMTDNMTRARPFRQFWEEPHKKFYRLDRAGTT